MSRKILYRCIVVMVMTLCSFGVSYAVVAKKTLYINRGEFTTVKKTTFPSLAYNITPTFNSTNAVLSIAEGDSLEVKVINRDTIAHGFYIKGQDGFLVSPGDSLLRIYYFDKVGTYIYYDSTDYPSNRYLGLGGLICVESKDAKNKYYWNIKEHSTAFSTILAKGDEVDWGLYEPDYFTINGKSFPDLESDSSATIVGQVSDTIYIYLANTGQSSHSIHFHGFHCTALQSSTTRIQLGASKDTFPLSPMDALLLVLIPDKVGRYSVHDHNLVAVSGGGTHPNGMFTIMTIQ